MRVLNVNSTLGLKTGGGTAERTFQMSRYLATLGFATTILTLDIELDEPRKQAVSPATVVTLPCLWMRFYIPRSGLEIIRRLVNESDIIHLMGHWSILNALVYVVARRENKPYVVCPAGALPFFGRSALLKLLYNLLVGYALIRNAIAWIAVTEGEFSHFESYGISSSEVIVIPNGVSEQDFPVTSKCIFLKRHSLPDMPYILFMGRLNPIKGPDLLLRAYIQACKNIPGYHLVFAGPDGGMFSGLVQEAKKAGVSAQVHFIGYVSGEDKSAAYRYAQLLVVPSRQEAMSIVAVEAGICGTPVLLTNQCGFSDVRQVDSRMEVEATVEGIATGLSNLLVDPITVTQISPAWKIFVEKRYAWSNIVEEYLKLYRGIMLLPVHK
jgi:glycosyltransferase involved in cell wall biosynthesis